MKTSLLIILLFITTFTAAAQIDMTDSTAQVISYWEKEDKEIYSVTYDKIKLNGDDTTSRVSTTYDVEITVINATDTSYTIQWDYKNFDFSNVDATDKKLLSLSKDMKVIYATDEFGSFVEVVNWKEIRNYMMKGIDILKDDIRVHDAQEKILQQVELTFSTKEAIEAIAIKDIQQFHNFHGGKYKLGELVEGSMQLPNVIGKEPFDVEVTISLDEINTENYDFLLTSTQSVNKDQLTNATYEYLVAMADLIKETPPKRDDLKDLTNKSLTTSRINDIGWIIYSLQTTTVTSDSSTIIEIRRIELN